MLESKGIITHKGTIVDATFVDAPRQRNTRDQNEQIRKVKLPKNGKRILISSHRKTEMPAGQRKTMKRIMDTRIIPKSMQTAKSSQIMKPHQQRCMTAMCLRTFWMKKTRSFMQTVPMLEKKYRSILKIRFVKKDTVESLSLNSKKHPIGKSQKSVVGLSMYLLSLLYPCMD